MTSKLRIEYVRPQHPGDGQDLNPDAIVDIVAPGETLTIGAASVQSSVAPDFPSDRGFTGGVFARLTCVLGAVVVTEPAANPTATEAAGTRLRAGETRFLPVETGQRLAAIEALDAPGDLVIEPDGFGVTPVSTTRAKWVDDFGALALDPSLWEVYDGGVYGAGSPLNGSGVTGITYSVNNSVLSVVMGTTALAELWLVSKKTFSIPLDLYAVIQFSQRLAANDVFFELVECDAATGALVPHASVAGEVRNRGGAYIGGSTSAGHVQLEATCDDSPANSSVSTTAGVSKVAAPLDLTLEFRAMDTMLSEVAADTVAAKNSAPLRLSRQVPDPNKPYKLRLRFRNNAAPATSTTVSILRTLICDVQELTVELATGRGDQNPNKGVPVNLVSSALPAGTAAVPMQGAYASNASGSPGNPVGIAGAAVSTAGGPAAVTSGRGSIVQQDLAGRPVMGLLGNPQSQDQPTVTLSTTGETTLIASVASIRHTLVAVNIDNQDSVDHRYLLRDATAGTVRRRIKVKAGEVLDLVLPARGLDQAAQAANWTIQMNEAQATASTIINATSVRTTA